jgi:hypothetical protein
LQPFVPFDCDSDIKKQPKLSKTGVRVKTLLYREETLLSRDTPLYWFKAPSPKLFCHEGPSTSVRFSTELLWLNVCFKKRFGGDVIYFNPKIVRDLDVLARWDSAQNEQWMWMTNIFKNDKKGPRAEFKISGAEKTILTGKAEINNMCEALGM